MNGKKLPPATLGRCVVIEMRRRKSDELIDPFKHVDDEGLAQLRQRLARWSINNETALRVGGPPMPPGFENRRADNWRLQLAIADLVGGDWGDQARTAAVKIERAVDKSSIGTQALTDIRKIFAESKADCLLSATIVEALTEDPDGPWAEYSHGQKLTQGKLARLLKPYGIVSMTLHPPGVSVKGKGYRRWQFEDAWERYLPGDDGTEKGSPPP